MCYRDLVKVPLFNRGEDHKKIISLNLRQDDRDLLIQVSLTMIKENDFQDFCNTYVEGDHLIQVSLIYD